MQERVYAGLQVSKLVGLKVSKLAGLQVGKLAGLQLAKNTPCSSAPPLLRSPALLLFLLFLLSACATTALPETAVSAPKKVVLAADGQQLNLTTSANNVRELLEEAGITVGDSDEVTPPLFTLLTEGMTVTIVRITESIEIIPRSIPFERKIVRSEALNADDPPRILQAGQTGLQEVTVRIVYRNGLEAERYPTQATVITPAQDEIIMVGIGAARDNLRLEGLLAYISSGTAVLLRSATLFPTQLETGGPLDGRVFALSPTGSHLLYTRTTTQTMGFNNSLWVVGTERGARPQPLGVSNVLWADWNPARAAPLQIAYTTAISTSLPPGWEANNDLWLGEISAADPAPFNPRQVVESYPATFGWWGGNYAWSPTGRSIAYSFANEVGVIEVATGEHIPLQRFTEYNTLADWVWVPTLSWSGDGRFLAFTNHNAPTPAGAIFDSWVLDSETGLSAPFVTQAGMWAHLKWAPDVDTPDAAGLADSQLAFLRTTNPLDSQRSSYTLWLMDQDGSNARQIYPAPGENSRFPRDPNFLAWGPTGREMAFVFNDALYLYSLDGGTAVRITQDDARASHPTWAPYGAGRSAPAPAVTLPQPTRPPEELPPVE